MARPSLNSGAPLMQEGQKAKLSWSSIKQLKWIFNHIKPYSVTFIFGLFFLIAGSIISLLFPWLIGKITDVVNGKEIEPWLGGAFGIFGWLMGVFGTQAFFSFFRVLFFVRIGEKVLFDIRSKVYEKLIAQPIQFFQEQKVGELNSRVTLDLSYIQDVITTTSAELIRQFLVIIGGVFFLFTQTSTKLTLIMLGVFPVLIAVAIFFGIFIRKMARKAQQKMADTQAVLEESLQNITTVKAFANEAFEIGRFKDNLKEVVKFGIKGGFYRAMFSSFIVLVVFGAIIGIIFMGFLEVQKGNLSLGALISFITYSGMVGASMGSLSTLISDFQRAVGASERVFEMIHQEGEPIHTPNNPALSFSGAVEWKNVSFSYPSRKDHWVLNQVNFTIQPNEMYGIVGRSGAGKSTIAALLLRLFEISDGEISWGGVPFHQIPLTQLRENIGIVPQEVLLFHGTIAENIAYGKPDAGMDEINDAAQRAHVLEFVQKLPDGLNTIVGEKGAKLSGGQRQRIAIARALVKKPKLLVFDEATSALDHESEKMVQYTIQELRGTCTMVIIAHRPSTLEVCSKILVMDGHGSIETVDNEDISAILAGLKSSKK